MNNRRRQKIRALNMLVRSQSNGKFSYSSILNIAKELMDAIAVAFSQASVSFVDLGETVKSFSKAIPEANWTNLTWSQEPVEEESHMKHCPCEVCNNGVEGYTDCKLHLEGECREGGGYEAFAPREDPDVPEYTGFMPETTWKQVIVLVGWALWFFAAGVAFQKYLLPLILSWF